MGIRRGEEKQEMDGGGEERGIWRVERGIWRDERGVKWMLKERKERKGEYGEMREGKDGCGVKSTVEGDL